MAQNSISNEEDNSNVVPPKIIPCVLQEIKPFIGKSFESIEKAFNFYNAYARVGGFSVRKGSQRTSIKLPIILWRAFMCFKEGERDAKRDKGKKTKMRVGCEARLKIRKKKNSSQYYVSKFVEEHNHEVTTPSKTFLLRSQKNMDEGAKRLIKKWTESGLGTPNIMKILSNESGGVRGFGFDEDQCRNYIQSIKRKTYGNDGRCLMDYFMKKKEENSSFYFELKIDDDEQIENCFWVDAQARADYYHLGDVVVFDTTYKTNKYLIPFAPFTGVNQHKQSILFGCALLLNEKEDSFKWLFKTWLKAMDGRPPKAIITDQDPAMGAVIADVFPNAHHRLCMWHILQKVPEKLGAVYRKYPSFKKDFNDCLHGSETVEEFEYLWEKLVENYELRDFDWLDYMYQIRHKWMPVYLKDIFFVGMSTTQRSESMNKLFDGYVHVHTSLSEFVIQFEKAIGNRCEKENKKDFKTANEQPNMKTSFAMEKQIAEIYTRKVFKEVQQEIWASSGYICQLQLLEEHEDLDTYEVYKDGDVQKKVHIVTYEKAHVIVACSCRKWEFQGIFCRHIFSIFLRLGIRKFPNHCIMKKWTPTAKKGIVYDSHGNEIQSNLQKCISVRFNELSFLGNRCAQSGVLYEKTFEFARDSLKKVIEKIDSINDEEACKIASVGDEREFPRRA